jgi:hypothetical protein
MPSVTGQIAYGGEAAPATAAPAQPKTSGEGKPETEQAAASATAAPGTMTPEEVQKLHARQESLEKTLAQINDEINKAPDAAGRDALELMRTNVQNNLTEVRDALRAQSTPAKATAEPPSGAEQKPSSGGEQKPATDDHPPR